MKFVVAWIVVGVAYLAAGNQAVAGETDDNTARSVSASQVDIAPVVDDFQGRMRPDWQWLRENSKGWRLTDQGLQVLVEPGNMWGGSNDAKNVLLHAVPAAWRDGVDVRVRVEHHPKKRWEQANLVWYYSDATMVKLGLEIEHDRTNIVMGQENGDRTKTIAIVPYPAEVVELRMVVQGLELRGYYRSVDAVAWQEVGAAKLSPDAETPVPQISLQFYQGDENSDRWATVSKFRMEPTKP